MAVVCDNFGLLNGGGRFEFEERDDKKAIFLILFHRLGILSFEPLSACNLFEGSPSIEVLLLVAFNN